MRRSNIVNVIDGNKQNKTTIKSGQPNRTEGIEGDISVRLLREGLKLYVKARGGWHGVSIGENYKNLEKQVEELKYKVSSANIRQYDTIPATNGFVAGGGVKAGLFKSQGNYDVTLKTGNILTGFISIQDGSNGGINVKPNGTGVISLHGKEPDGSDSTLSIPSSLVKASAASTTQVLVHESNVLKYRTTAEIISDGGGQASLTFGISDTNAVKIDSGSVADDEYARFTANGLESRSTAEVLSDIGAQATVTAGTNCTFSGATLNVDDAFVKNDVDDTMAGTLTIDKNYTGTTTASFKGMHIDVDQTGIVASGQTVTGIGLDLDINTESVTHVGNINNVGIDIDMVAATDGYQSNVGVSIDTSGGDDNLGLAITSTGNHIKLSSSADAQDNAILAVGANGATTLTTVENGGGSGANLNLSIDGDIYMSAAGGDITMDTMLSITDASEEQLKLLYDSNNYVTFQAGDNGVLTITTIDGGATDTQLILKNGDLSGDQYMVLGNGSEGSRISSNGAQNLRLTTNEGTNAGYIQLVDAANGDIELVPNGTGKVELGVATGGVLFSSQAYFSAETANTCDSSGGAAAATINWVANNKQKLTITGTSNTINFTNPTGPCSLILKIIQGDGSDTITAGHFHANVKWAGGTRPTLSTGNGAIDIVSFYFDGTSYHGVASLAFATA